MAMLQALAPRFEPHPIVDEFVGIIESGRAAPILPGFLHRALARGAVSILPPVVRQRLQLGPEWNLTRRDALALSGTARDAAEVDGRHAAGGKLAVHGKPADLSRSSHGISPVYRRWAGA